MLICFFSLCIIYEGWLERFEGNLKRSHTFPELQLQKSHLKNKQMIDTSWHSGRKGDGRRGRMEWVEETPLGNKMLFAALVKIMTHQMEHFKEIHTQLSWLSSFSILPLLCFPLAPRFTVTLSFLP